MDTFPRITVRNDSDGCSWHPRQTGRGKLKSAAFLAVAIDKRQCSDGWRCTYRSCTSPLPLEVTEIAVAR